MATKLKKLSIDFLVAYVPYSLVAMLAGWPLGVAWWKVLIIMASAIILNMAVNIITTVLSTYRFGVMMNYKNRKKA